MKKTIYSFFIATLLCVGFTACGDDDDDVKLPDITVNFNSSELGMDDDTESVEASINLSRAYTAAFDVTINVVADGVTYGEQFTTNPAVQDDQIKVTVPAGSTSASFTVARVADAFLEGTESIQFTLLSVSATEGVVLGDKKDLKLSFEAIVSDGETLTLQGRTDESNYANVVYVDFSTNTQTAVDRKSWALGFYSGDQFRVFLNPSMQMAAAATDKTDLSAVSTADLEGLPTLVPVMMEGKFIGLDNVDDLGGDLIKTAIAEVSATDAENKVHIVVMEDPAGGSTKIYYKVRVLRNSDGYKLEYALLDATETSVMEVAKDSEYNLVGVSLADKKTVGAEPKAKNWDISWSYGTGSTNYGGSSVAYFMQDLISLNNLGGTEAVEVLESSVDVYPTFTLADAQALTFAGTKNLIGTIWRVTANMSGSTESTGVRTNRFYVIKDPAGNYYKLRFLKIGINDDGLRGNPQIEYALLK